MPQSASLRASTSFTPSPVMATVWPCLLRAWTNFRFWLGVTRPGGVLLHGPGDVSVALQGAGVDVPLSALDASGGHLGRR